MYLNTTWPQAALCRPIHADTCPLGTPIQIRTDVCLYYVYYVLCLAACLAAFCLYYAVSGSFQRALCSDKQLTMHIT